VAERVGGGRAGQTPPGKPEGTCKAARSAATGGPRERSERNF